MEDLDLDIKIDNYIIKVSNLINNFNLNVVVANVYSVYNLFYQSIEKNISNFCYRKNFCKFLKTLIPFIPHLAYECLDKLNEKNIDNWPQAEKKLNMKEKIKVAIQINGKTRKIIDVYRDLSENDVVSACLKDKKLDKQLNKKRIFKTIFVQNKIINFLIK